MRIKIIKTENEYKEALVLLENLMDKNPELGTEDAEKLELLATLIQKYEEQLFPYNVPDPIDAILFRMEQQGLTQKDLIPYIGSKSKVSEVLSRKRPLTLNMMKSLVDALGIPPKVLLNQKKEESSGTNTIYNKLPIKDLINRGYISAAISKDTEKIKHAIDDFLSVFSNSPAYAQLSRTYYIRNHRPVNKVVLQMWVAKIIRDLNGKEAIPVFNENSATVELMKKVIDCSDETDGIHKAIKMLNEYGIFVVVEPHLAQTYIDGAAIMLPDKNPIIALTIRHDRLDNFWFTLLHELAHIILHRNKGINLFYDNTEEFDFHNSKEKEADDFAIEVMVPSSIWRTNPASILPSKEAALKLAESLSVHPAIIAGRMRYENKFYSYLNSLIGLGEVRKYFPEINWS